MDDDKDEEREADRGVVDEPWEEGEGIAIRTATRTVVGVLELSSVNDIFVEFECALVPLSADDGSGAVDEGFKNILARVSKEGVVPVETSAVRRFSSSSPLGAEAFIGVETAGERPAELGVEPE